jgi:hypothetical protein
MYETLRGLGDVCAFGDTACYAAALSGNPPSDDSGDYTFIGPPVLTPTAPVTCAYNDLACLQSAMGITQSNPSVGVCLAGDTACLAQVAATLKAPPTQPPAPATAATPFCGAGSKQWVTGIDNCTVLEIGAVGVGILVLLLSSGSKRGRRR